MSIAFLPELEIGNTAVSEEGREVRRVVISETPSVSIDEARENQLGSLFEVFREASEPGWDGYGALAVLPSTAAQARAFLSLLPSMLPRPDISAHPDGELALEWSFGPDSLLTVSINDSGRLSYAWLLGHESTHGTEWFVDSIPDAVVLALKRFPMR
jgi:hypothetical protein